MTKVTSVKRFIFYLVASVFFSQSSFGDIRHLEGEVIAGKDDMFMNSFCVDGYKFVTVHAAINYQNEQPNIVQMFEEKNGNSVPAKC